MATPSKRFKAAVAKWTIEEIEDALRTTFVYYAPERKVIKAELARRKTPMVARLYDAGQGRKVTIPEGN